MAKIFLNVPIVDGAEAKNLGAEYHDYFQRWYFDSEKYNPARFEKWSYYLANVYANNFDVAKINFKCPSCQKPTRVYSIFINSGYQLDFNLDITEEIKKSAVFYIEFLNWDIYDSLIIPHTHYGYRSTECENAMVGRAIMNNCEYCMTTIPDSVLYALYGDSSVLLPEDIGKITYVNFDQPIFLFGNTMPLSPKFDFMREVSSEEFIKIFPSDDTPSPSSNKSIFQKIKEVFFY